MSKGITKCKKCGHQLEDNFIKLVKQVMNGLTCPKCGHCLGLVKNLDTITKEGNKNE